MSQHDLFGDAAQVSGFRGFDAAVGGRAAERLPVEHEVVDAGFQVGAVDRLVLIVGVVEVDARRSLAHDAECHADRRHPRSGGFGHGACACGVVAFEGCEIGEPAVAKMLTPLFHLFNIPAQLEHTIAFVVGFSVITALHIVLGELVPKSLSIQKTEKVVLFIAWPLIVFNKLMYPAVWFLNHVANWTLRRMGIHAASEAEEAHNEEEIRILMEESYKYGYIDKTELTYLDNVFDFSERHASEIMVPRTDMICLYLKDSFTENIEVALSERMTRYPICEEDKDHIIGFLHIKDLLRALNAGQKPDLRTLAREVLVVPESMPISKLLRLLQKQRKQLAILIDEYGGTAGMVTIEDILEEIVGEIQDEFDEERPEVEEESDKTYSIDGKMLLEDVNDLFGLELSSNSCDTIGGWVYSQLDYPPQLGQSVKLPKAEFLVEELDNIRITRLKVKLLQEPGSIHQGMLEEQLNK